MFFFFKRVDISMYEISVNFTVESENGSHISSHLQGKFYGMNVSRQDSCKLEDCSCLVPDTPFL